MLTLAYKFVDSPLHKDIDIEKADDTELEYYLFTGDIILTDGASDFTTDWEWIPLLHFATSLKCILNEIRSEQESSYEFSESEATLNFKRSGTDIEITASYAEGKILVAYAELKQKATVLFANLMQELKNRHPEIEKNQAFKKISDDLLLG